MIVKKKTLQSCKGPLLPRGVNTPFPPLAAMPDATLTLLHGTATYSHVPGTSSSALLQPCRLDGLPGSILVTVAVVATAMGW